MVNIAIPLEIKKKTANYFNKLESVKKDPTVTALFVPADDIINDIY